MIVHANANTLTTTKYDQKSRTSGARDRSNQIAPTTIAMCVATQSARPLTL